MSVPVYFMYYIVNSLKMSLATLKVALKNVMCVAHRGKLDNLL